ncbi:MAG TPA: HlyD family efflux transporter periplasmic adaptor subunit [Ideonella sp.]|uniref:HlyD family secretion protein n=1 Tax=Ideonella sp. TaxID=1929293 RepID=UPI002D041874|nr:HlyD family efflux transporter periplasmic adaptor subunit [Ideonella sp.]HSI49649.1 HlyD family efflux transporter periplasmic adaptor subunit [Ideonella sp.]
MSLFRPEAVQHRQQEWLGAIQLSRPLGLRWVTAGVVLSVALVAAFLALGQASRRAHLSGVLMPDQGLVRIVPPLAATVQQVSVAEGQQVNAGDVLFILRVDGARLNEGSQAQLQQTFDARIHSLEEAAQRATRLQGEQAHGQAERAEGLQRELAQLDDQASLQAQRLALVEKAQARLEALEKSQFVSSAQVQARAEDVLGLRAEAAALQRQRQTLARELTQLQAEQRELPLQSAQQVSDLLRQRDEIAEAAARANAAATQRTLPLRAQSDGTLSSVNVSAGQPVNADAALATLLPAGAKLQAQLYAPSSALGFVSVGQAVQLRLQAYPYQRYGWLNGQVMQVALAPVQAAELALLPLAAKQNGSSEPMYRITVALAAQAMSADGQARPLLPGMQLEADVLLERRRLAEWLFEPLLGWRKRI